MRYAALALCGVVAASSSCSCGGDRIMVTDAFATDEERADGDIESTHRYASNSRIPWEVRSNDGSLDIATVDVVASDGLSIDDDPALKVSSGVMSLSILTGDAGSGTVIFKDKDGTIISSRDITVAEVDEMKVDITAPDAQGIALPELDIERIRIATGRSAALRVELFADGEPVYGLESVDAVAADTAFTTTQRSGCSSTGCRAASMASEIKVPADAVDPTDVVLTAGTASLTVTVIPTSIDDVTSFVLDEQTVSADRKQDDVTGIVALVSVGNEPLFGAPVAWTIDGTAVEGTGDTIRYGFVEGADATLVAKLGDNTATVQAPTNAAGIEVTSITSACTQSSGVPWWLGLGGAALLMRRRRRA